MGGSVTVCADAYTDVYVAAALDQAGKLLDVRSFPATSQGCVRLATWARAYGQIEKVVLDGIDDSPKAQLMQLLVAREITVSMPAGWPGPGIAATAGRSRAT